MILNIKWRNVLIIHTYTTFHTGSLRATPLYILEERMHRTVRQGSTNYQSSDFQTQYYPQGGRRNTANDAANQRAGLAITTNKIPSFVLSSNQRDVQFAKPAVDTLQNANALPQTSGYNITTPNDRATGPRTTHNITASTERPNAVADSIGVILDKPKYRALATIESRLRTFKSWPRGHVQKPQTLAEAGFAFIGTKDDVRCYFCGGGLCEWSEKHDPWEEHARHYRHCAHVRQCKGDNFVRRVHGELPNETDANQCGASGGVKDESETVRTGNEIAIATVKEFDFDDKLISKAVKKLMSLDETRAFKAVDLVKAIQKLEAGEECVAVRKDSSKTNMRGIEDSEAELDMEETNRRLKEGMLCKICFDADACIITLPCSHMISCPQCAPALTKCALCREPIKGTVRAYMTTCKRSQ